MKLLRYITLASLLALGFAPELSGYYARVFGSDITIVSSAEQPCILGGKCRTSYKIQLPNNTYKSPTIGLGVLVPAAKVYCTKKPEAQVSFGNPEHPGESTSESIIKYQLFEFEKESCQEITIDIYAPSEFRRYGKIGGQTVLGEFGAVKKVQKFSDFFLRDFKLICFFFLLFLFALSAVYSNVYSPKKSEILDYPRSFIYWGCFLGISSGVAVVFIPVTINPLLIVRATSFFSILTHILPVVLILSESLGAIGFRRGLHTRFSRFKFNFGEVAVLVLCLSPYFALSQGPLSLIFGAAGFLLGLMRRRFYLSAFSLALVMNGAAFYRAPFAPSFSLTILVALHCLAETAIITLLRGRRLLEISFWVKSALSINGSSIEVRKRMAGEYLNLINGSELSVCLIHGDQVSVEKFSLVNTEVMFEEISLRELPPVFAHVMSTESELWHVHVDSPLYLNIYKGDLSRRSETVRGAYFTALPLYRAENLFGFIFITGYSDDKATDEFEQALFRNATSGVLEVIQRSAAVSEVSLQIDRLLSIASFSGEINKHKPESVLKLSETLSECAGEGLNCRAIVYHLSRETMSLSPCSFKGYTDAEIDRYRTWKIYTVNQNEQGPAALAVSRQSPVLVPSLSLIESVLYHETVTMMKLSGICSVSAIPLVRTFVDGTGNDRQYVWGLLWLESATPNYFHPASRQAFTHLKEILRNVSDKVFQQMDSAKMQRKIDGLIPARVQARWINGEVVEETRQGFLIIADIRGSTKISKTIGGSAWLSFANGLTEEISAIAIEYGFELASWSWDAFHLLRDYRESDRSGLQDFEIAGLADKVESLIRSKVSRAFPNLYDDEQPYYTRVCVGSGDITTGIIKGITDSWGIIGAAMAVVTKMEQAAKSIPGRVFAVASAISVADSDWSQSRLTFAGSENTIFTYSKIVNIECAVEISVDEKTARKAA